MSYRVLIVDDEQNIRRMLLDMLELAGYQAEDAADGMSALKRCGDGDVDAVLLDVRMEGLDGLQLLPRLLELESPPVVVMMSGHGSIATALAAVKAGASDFLEKPLTRDHTLLALENALSRRDLQKENRRLRELLHDSPLLGDSPAMGKLRERIAAIAAADSRVLIRGESGSGKELVAHEIHRRSARSDRPFVALNCAAIPAELIESELFGHTRGAFTGATSARAGVFENAHRGTLFLDEIGDMPLTAQAKLLRVLESGQIRRVGDSRDRPVDVRVLAATHRDLRAAMTRDEFREDLFHRLDVLRVVVPPLRERLEDVAALAEFFLERELRRQKLAPTRFRAAALKALGRHHWPGNVRELRNVVERLAVLSMGAEIDEADVVAELPSGGEEGAAPTLKEVVAGAERRAILAAIRGSGGNLAEAARRLGLERSHLYKKARQLGLELRED